MAKNKKFITLDNLKTFARELKNSDFIKASGAIIDVDELPTKDIDPSKIYRIVQKTAADITVEHKVFIASYFYENEKVQINSLEEQFTQLGLVKNEDYFEFIKPYNPEAEAAESWSQTQIVLIDFEKFYEKMIVVIAAEQGTDMALKVFYHELADHTELDNYLQSLNGIAPTEEELSSNCVKLGFIKLAEKYYSAEIGEAAVEEDDNNWVNLCAVLLMINPDTGLYQQSGDVMPIHAAAGDIFGDFDISAINAYQNNADELMLSDISDFAETYAELINDSDRPWEFNPKHLWINIEHQAETQTGATLYTYYAEAWHEIGAGSASESAKSIAYETTAPTKDNEPGKLNYVVLDEEPKEKYEGYIYIINSEDGSSDEGSDISNLPLASEEDIELIFGIVNIDNDITVEDTTLVVGDDTTIDDNEHLLDLDGE